MGILTTDKKRLVIFEEGIRINDKLPKYDAINRFLAEKAKNSNINIGRKPLPSGHTTDSEDNDAEEISLASSTPNLERSSTYKLKDEIDFDEIASLGIDDINNYIAEHSLHTNIFGYGYHKTTSISNYLIAETPIGGINKQDSRLRKTWRYLCNKINQEMDKLQDGVKMDVLEFFNDVKLTSKESLTTYRDRIAGYLASIHNAKICGQTALVEKLLKEIVFTKYDAYLYSIGKYYVITEQQIVDFAKKTEKGLALTYIANYARPLPAEIVSKITETNDYHIFDNYVIMHYDPSEKGYRETEYERAKRKDPILFGVLAGSDRLYFIADWVDEYCDLTLNEIVDTLHIDKEDLLQK